MTRLALLAACLACFCGWVGLVSALSELQHGAKIGTKAYEIACWYENLRRFPSNRKSYMQCLGQGDNVFEQMTDDKTIEEYFGEWFLDPMTRLPSHYGSSCNSYLKDPKKAPATKEGDALNDNQNDQPYPFQGFAYCVMGRIRETYGDKAMEDIKNENTHARKQFRTALLERENLHRAHHGVEPLKSNAKLNAAAQQWADKLARECKMYHSNRKDKIRQFQGAGTGENLSAGPKMSDEFAALMAANGWYEEIRDYPYPEGFDGADRSLFKKIGHFTQSVWKGSQLVGYGIGVNPNCGKHKYYIAARYFPSGNRDDEFQANVLPPRE